MTAAELYAAMCRFAEDNGYYRRSPDEGGWWDHEEGCGRGDMTIGELVEEEFMRQKVDARLPPVAPLTEIIEVKIPQMEPCSWCGGHGLRTGAGGDVIDCRACGGGGLVEARDERGRFLPWLTIREVRGV